MEKLEQRTAELFMQGYMCSQVMMLYSLEMREIENPLLMRAMGAFGGGMHCGDTCGTLAGGVSMLASYCPRAEGEPEPKDSYAPMVAELVQWFKDEYGSINCRDIVEPAPDKIMAFCPGMLARTFEKCIDILQGHDIDPYE